MPQLGKPVISAGYSISITLDEADGFSMAFLLWSVVTLN